MSPLRWTHSNPLMVADLKSPSDTEERCPSCGAATSGRFCAECGASLRGGRCGGCGESLSAGARFCHRCGTAAAVRAGATQPSARQPISNALPWAFAAIALLAFGAYVAGQHFGGRSNPAGSGGMVAGPMAGGVMPSAGDISALSPEERADRLHDRVMRLYEAGRADSVQFFAPMALDAFLMLPSLDEHRRYDLGRIAEISGELGMARAQSDTILSTNPEHLLGLILASHVAERESRVGDRAEYQRRLLAAAELELARNPEEYQLHANDINVALAEARRAQ